jgi:hypothetical protein
MIEPRALITADGLRLEAELATPGSDARAAVVLCHPHPQYGGTMRSLVIGALFDALPRAGITCLRFNFRGVEGSGGSYDEGHGELLDARAALDALAHEAGPGLPLLLAGWSFGADITLSTIDERLGGWLAIAPPLRFADDFAGVASDPRPKLLVLAQHDEFRDPASVVEATASWQATEVDVVPGASHFFVGRTDRLAEIALDYLNRIVAPRSVG